MANHINDDALGRTLDALFDCGVSDLFEKIALHTCQCLNITPKSLHIDTTSFHVDGRYDVSEDRSCIRLKHGYSRDGHPELKQVILQLVSSAEGNLPIYMRPMSGNCSDQETTAQLISSHIESLRAALDSRYIVGDCAMYTPKSIHACHENQVLFVTRVPATLAQAKQYLHTTKSEMMVDIGDGYRACEYRVCTHGCPQRWVVVHSTHAKKRNKEIQEHKWKTRCMKAEKDFRRLCRKSFSCQEDAKRALLEYSEQHPFVNCDDLHVNTEIKYKKMGRPTKDAPSVCVHSIQGEFSIHEDAFEQWCLGQNFFILATNDLRQDMLSMKDILDTYKSQQSVERGFRFLKSPEFFTSAFFVKKPERIEALLMIMTLSLLVYGSIEHKIRQELQDQEVDFVDQKKKPTRKPTAQWVFFCFLGFHVVYIQNRYKVVNLNARRATILRVLGSPYQKYYKGEWHACQAE